MTPSDPMNDSLIAAGGVDFRQLYRTMLTARYLDLVEAELVAGGEAFFHVPCRGHEGIAVLNYHLRSSDWILPHYRDKALLLGRGIGVASYFHTLFSNACSSSAGRHMTDFASCPELRIVSGVVPVGNHALHAVGIASRLTTEGHGSLAVCSMGDGTTQQGEVYEALAEAARNPVPVLFFIQDNQYAISTKTANKTFYSFPNGEQPTHHMGIPIHHVSGTNVVEANEQLGPVIAKMRETGSAAIVIFHLERLSSHTNADDQRVYRSESEREAAERDSDPVENLAQHLRDMGVPDVELQQIESQVDEYVRGEAATSKSIGDPPATTDAKRPLSEKLQNTAEYSGMDSEERLTMLESMRTVLKHQLGSDERVRLLGEDIEDPKGDVFGVTRGLSTEFPDRVVNSALSESTILGVSIGQALTGSKPVAFVQFADFIHPAFNQIISELGQMYWRSNGQWESPVIVMVACGGYRPGLGPYHSQTNEAIMAHVPGIDVFMPSTAGDAAGLLNAAFESNRPTIFFYPKTCLNDPDRSTSSDADKQIVVPGKARRIKKGSELTLVSWGSTMSLCEQSAKELEAAGASVDLFDLRTISPWDRAGIMASAEKTGRLVVVHEDNQTCGFAAEIISSVCESSKKHIQCRRVVRGDVLPPCNYRNQLEVMPSVEKVLSASAELLGMELVAEETDVDSSNILTVEATGSSPADQSITVLEWRIKPGDEVTAGQNIAEMDADKAVFDLASPADGVIHELLVEENETVRLGAPILQIQVASSEVTAVATSQRKLTLRRRTEQPAETKTAETETVAEVPTRQRQSPMAKRVEKTLPPIIRLLDHVKAGDGAVTQTVGLSRIYTALGSQPLTNEKLSEMFPEYSDADILRRTGITSRPALGKDENVLTLAIAAAKKALHEEQMSIRDIDAIICSTTTPMSVTPALSCRVLDALNDRENPHEVPAYDISAACAGYLYSLANGFDFLNVELGGTVLVLTSEAMTEISSREDFDTAILFGDAASATILRGPAHERPSAYQLHRPLITALGESGAMLGATDEGYLKMDGRKVFAEAVRHMADILDRVCVQTGVDYEDLDQIVPHQANGRIIDAIRRRLGVDAERMFNNISQLGNTSSSSIPLALADMMDQQIHGTIGLTAFGAGFTLGAAILSHPNEEVIRRRVA